MTRFFHPPLSPLPVHLCIFLIPLDLQAPKLRVHPATSPRSFVPRTSTRLSRITTTNEHRCYASTVKVSIKLPISSLTVGNRLRSSTPRHFFRFPDYTASRRPIKFQNVWHFRLSQVGRRSQVFFIRSWISALASSIWRGKNRPAIVLLSRCVTIRFNAPSQNIDSAMESPNEDKIVTRTCSSSSRLLSGSPKRRYHPIDSVPVSRSFQLTLLSPEFGIGDLIGVSWHA